MIADQDFQRLLDYLDRPWAGYRKVRKGVKRRVRQHMEMLGCRRFDDYLDIITGNPAARAECEQRLMVTISRFFRDRKLWEHLRAQILPLLMARFPQGLTAWSAGCANGEEPYSLGMLWEELAAVTPVPGIRILATDGAAPCIERARTGVYPAGSLKQVPAEMIKRWFQKVHGGRHYRIDDRLKERICWQVHELLDTPPAGPFHMILLRNNLLTYYRGRPLQTAFARITATLESGGVLIVGSHEHLPSSASRWARDSACSWVYWAP
jgi:chemotaxis protein methyltransferase CheR